MTSRVTVYATPEEMEKLFDDLELRARNSGGNCFSETDIEMARKGLAGGLSVKAVKQVLKIYGSSKCGDAKYIKALMKSEDIQEQVNEIKKEEKILSR